MESEFDGGVCWRVFRFASLRLSEPSLVSIYRGSKNSDSIHGRGDSRGGTSMGSPRTESAQARQAPWVVRGLAGIVRCQYRIGGVCVLVGGDA